ncbi:unnamed protein product [Parnassius apollo]|uniref:(apollo) hypothetical protein n=1 Tax=Parnassius apollo TaxID=110799 RepID=A0A8S3X5L0_PARAO|nr:unnamed protein product [Parnassius apollo]
MNRPKGSVQKEIVTYMFASMLNIIVESWEVIGQDKIEENYLNKEFENMSGSFIFPSKKKKPIDKNSKLKRSKTELFNETQGHFKDNEINGRGLMKWKDDTWYEGDFVGNLRQGHGLYVDSRVQRSYIGQWYSGTKHGQGVIYYSDSFKNSYDGQWLHNVRHGYGSREYCPLSGYEGEWDLYAREGKGLMIWPNHDWMKGQRHGCGMLNFGYDFGAHYAGEFVCNQKHGKGMLVSNNGFILRNKQLFQDDNLSASVPEDNHNWKREHLQGLYKFDISSNSVDLCYHIEQAIKDIEKQQQNDGMDGKEISRHHISSDLINFELRSLRKSLQYYETDLKIIYYKYCTICNTNKITFTPVLMRLYLWQIYYDCGIHEKGLTLVEIDNIFCQNPKWLARSPHDPFEPIFFWQFLHSLLSIASKLYAKKQLPGAKPDTILANAFRAFMEKDILPGAKQQRGLLINGFCKFIPLKSLYNLYLSLGEPHTLLTFLRAVRLSPHEEEYSQLPLEETSDHLPLGRNVNIFGDEIMYVLEFFEVFVACAIKRVCEDEKYQLWEEFPLQDFGMKAPPQTPNDF